MGTNFNLPPGRYVTELGGLKVGATIKNHFGRKARIAYLYLAASGQKLFIYQYENGSDGIQGLESAHLLQEAKA